MTIGVSAKTHCVHPLFSAASGTKTSRARGEVGWGLTAHTLQLCEQGPREGGAEHPEVGALAGGGHRL